MKKSELRKLIRETILQELNQPIKEQIPELPPDVGWGNYHCENTMWAGVADIGIVSIVNNPICLAAAGQWKGDTVVGTNYGPNNDPFTFGLSPVTTGMGAEGALNNYQPMCCQLTGGWDPNDGQDNGGDVAHTKKLKRKR